MTCSFQSPDFLKSAAGSAIDDGQNQYTRPGGSPFLVETLAEFYKPIFKRTIDPMSEIVSFNGAQTGIFSIMASFCNPGDEVVCIEPFFDAYKKASALVGAKTVGVPLDFNPSASVNVDNNKIVIDRTMVEEVKLKDKTHFLILENYVVGVYRRADES